MVEAERHDQLEGGRVLCWLPAAEQVTLEDCGHVPQVERPEETHRLLLRFFARAEAESRTGVRPDARPEAEAA